MTGTAFGALVRSILHQQVSIGAGRAFVRKLAATCGGTIEPASILALADTDLQAAGLSRGKARYVRALAVATVEGGLDGIEELPDDEVEQRLIQLPGIGVWTVKMFLLFHLLRPDVFSGGDLGLREAIRVLDDLEAPPTPAQAETRAEIWRPYRSVAAISLWDFLRRTRLSKREAGGI